MEINTEIKMYGKIAGVNLVHNFLPPFALSVCFLMITPFLFNINALSSTQAARPIEFWLCFVGVILLVSVFLPEQDKDIRDVIRTKKFDYNNLCIIRLLYSVGAMAVLIILFTGIMKFCESDVRAYHVLGGIASAWFLGAVGFAVAGITDNVMAGYMSSILYYLASYGLKEKLGKFFLFPMSYGGNGGESGWLIGGAVVLTILTVGIIKCRHKCSYLFIKYGNE